MSWYRTGVITLTNGSTRVVGLGTLWMANVIAGSAVNTPAGRFEVDVVLSNTEIDLATPYTGASQVSVAYSIEPTQGYMVSAAKQLGQLMSVYGGIKDAYQGGTLLDLTRLTENNGAQYVGSTLPPSSTNIELPRMSLDFFIRSSPIDVRRALPGNFDVSGAVDYSVEIQKVLNYLRDFGGGKMLLPPRTTLNAANLRLYSGIEVIGPDWTSVMLINAGAYGFSINPGAAGTTNPEDNQRNIALRGFQVLGKVATAGFQEHTHLLNWNAASWCEVDRMKIAGFQGDGLYLGSSNTAGTERHNQQILVTDSLFDGINADNRNGISIIDGDGVRIRRSRFLNTTRVGMPGSIDCEPDANAYAIVRNIEITQNFFKGGNEAGVALLLRPQSTLTVPHENFLIEGNEIQKPKGLTFFGEVSALTDSTVPYNVEYRRNTVKNTTTPFLFSGARGLTLTENVFEDSQAPAEMGYTVGNFDVRSVRNIYRRLGKDTNTGIRGLYVRDAKRLTFDGDTFEDCGRADGTAGRSIEFVSGKAGSYIKIRNTTFSSPTGKTNYVIFASGYTFDNGTCEDFNNAYLFGSNNDFAANLHRRATTAPTTGTWYAGNEVFPTAAVLAATGIERWKCLTGGTPGTWDALRLHSFRRFVSRNYAVSENFDAGTYDVFSLNIQANPALTYNAPTGGTIGQEITIRVRNISGGAMGAITWNAVFKMSGWTNPINTKSRSVTFVFDGANWIEISQTVGDVAN